MNRLEWTIQIRSPAATVFKTVVDIPSWPRVYSAIDTIEMLSDGPVRQGTRFKETRTIFGRKASETMEVIELEPISVLTLGCESRGMSYRSKFTVSADGFDRCTLQLSMLMKPTTFGARLSSALMMPLFKGSMRKAIQHDLDQLKAACEDRADQA